MVEHWIVAPGVAGSIPVTHPSPPSIGGKVRHPVCLAFQVRHKNKQLNDRLRRLHSTISNCAQPLLCSTCFKYPIVARDFLAEFLEESL